MKVLGIALIIVAAAIAASAQTAASDESPPDVLILSQKFVEQTVRSYYVAPLPDPHPYNPAGGSQPEQSGWRPVGKRFLYQVKIRNIGGKEIRAINWVYVFTDPKSQKDVGRHQFQSSERIRPREEKTLSGASSSFPTQVVTADTLDRDDPKDYTERVLINCLAYSDGSVWQRASFRGTCEPVKQDK